MFECECERGVCVCANVCVCRTKLAVFLDEVDLGEDVDVRQLEMEHGREGEQHGRDVGRRHAAVVRIDQVQPAQLCH